MNGLGYAILPRMIVADAPELYKVDIAKLNGEPIVRKTWMLFHKDSLQLNIVKTFVEFIEERFQK